MNRRHLLLVAVLALAVRPVVAAPDAGDLPDGLYAEFATPHGAFVARLDQDRVPMTCMSFVGLAEGTLAPRRGGPFFSGLRWYRVVPDFVIQSGDPMNTGSAPETPAAEAAGHPYLFPDEMAPGLYHDAAGILSMANDGPDTNSSEFFITLRELGPLNYLHTVFGRVVRGAAVLPQVKPGEPFSIRIIRVGAAARAFRADPAAFRALVAAAKRYGGPAAPGPDAFFDDPDGLLPQDVPRARNFNFQLANFARFTGHRVYARVFRRFTPARPGQKLGSFNAELARRLGVEPDGLLVAYYADVDTWMIWIGKNWLARFMGRAGSRDEFVETGALMKRKETFIAEARRRAEATAGRLRAEGHPIDAPRLLKLTLDEVLDPLLVLYDSKTAP